jgi:WD40 repeat protein
MDNTVAASGIAVSQSSGELPMTRRQGVLTLLCLVFALGSHPLARGEPPVEGQAKPPAAERAPRTDLQGDPLPEGALARLGTIRFRNAGEVIALAFSPDGKLLLAGGGQGDEAVSLWDAATGMRRLRLPGQDLVRAVAFAPDGKRFAASFGVFHSPEDKYVCIWETATGKELHRLDTGYNVRGLAFSPDGKTLLVNGEKRALLWEPERNAKRELEGQPGFGNIAAFSPDGRVVATGSNEYKDLNKLRDADYPIRLWDAASGQLLHTLRGHEDRLEVITFSPDGKLLASGSMGDKSSVRLWDVATDKERLELPGRKGDAYAFFFAADGRSLLAANSDGKLRAWELPSGKALSAPKLDSPSPGGQAFAFSPDGKRLAMGCWLGAAGRANTIRLWDLASGRPLLAFPGHRGDVEALAFSPDGRRLVSGGRDGGALVWDVAKRRVVRRLGDDEMETCALAFSPDGTLIAAGGDHGTVTVWETASGDQRFRLAPRRKPSPTTDERDEVLERLDPIDQVLFSADGLHLSALAHGTVFALDIPPRGRTPGEPSWLAGPDDSIRPRTAAPFGRGAGLIVAYGPLALRYDAASGKELSRRGRFMDVDQVLGNWVRASALSPDARLVAIGSDTGALGLWELATGKEVLRLQRGGDNGAGVWSLAFDPSGRLLAAGRTDGEVRVWDCGSGKELGRRPGHRGCVRALAFSPDGSLLASGADDTTVLFWDMAEFLRTSKPMVKLGVSELEERWRLLAGSDAEAAHRAAAELAADPERALPFLGERLRGPTAAERDIERLIGDLDAEVFETRQRATADLKKLGTTAEPALRWALETVSSEEVRQRIRKLLEPFPQRNPTVLTGELVRTDRALRVVELVATPETWRLLRELVKEGRSAQIRAEAAAARERLLRSDP